MTHVLVAYASRMGSTREIAREIGRQLTRRGCVTTVCPAETALAARCYDAVVLGSPIYLRQWDQAAVTYLVQEAPELTSRPTWLFQSGPCDPEHDRNHHTGAQHEAEGTPRNIRKICVQFDLTTPRTFGGNLDPERATSMLSRLVTKGDLAGDYRDWEAIRAWADTIADHVLDQTVPATELAAG